MVMIAPVMLVTFVLVVMVVMIDAFCHNDCISDLLAVSSSYLCCYWFWLIW